MAAATNNNISVGVLGTPAIEIIVMCALRRENGTGATGRTEIGLCLILRTKSTRDKTFIATLNAFFDWIADHVVGRVQPTK